MQAITIGTEHRAQDIIDRLDEEFRFLHEEGIDVQVGLQNRGNYTFVGCSVLSGNPETDALFRHYVANALSDFIVEKWEQDLLKKIIRGHYYYFSRDEQERIMEHAGRNLAAPEEAGRSALHYKVSRKSKILHRLRDYLDQSNELVVEGFVHFRLRDYLEELEDAVDRAVDDFLMEREHHEFIRLLRYFVEVQEPRVEEVHVLIRPGGSFKLVDASGASLRSEVLEEFVVEMVESEVNYEDLLISALITLAPTRLVLHGQGGHGWEDGVETIKGVFGERVGFCQACHLCTAVAAERPQG